MRVTSFGGGGWGFVGVGGVFAFLVLGGEGVGFWVGGGGGGVVVFLGVV